MAVHEGGCSIPFFFYYNSPCHTPTQPMNSWPENRMRKLKSGRKTAATAAAARTTTDDGGRNKYDSPVDRGISVLDLYGRTEIRPCDKPRWMRKCNFAFFTKFIQFQ